MPMNLQDMFLVTEMDSSHFNFIFYYWYFFTMTAIRSNVINSVFLLRFSADLENFCCVLFYLKLYLFPFSPINLFLAAFGIASMEPTDCLALQLLHDQPSLRCPELFQLVTRDLTHSFLVLSGACLLCPFPFVVSSVSSK